MRCAIVIYLSKQDLTKCYFDILIVIIKFQRNKSALPFPSIIYLYLCKLKLFTTCMSVILNKYIYLLFLFIYLSKIMFIQKLTNYNLYKLLLI